MSKTSAVVSIVLALFVGVVLGNITNSKGRDSIEAASAAAVDEQDAPVPATRTN